MSMISNTAGRTGLFATAALLAGATLLAVPGHAGNTAQPIGSTTGVVVQSGTTLRMAPLKCESSGSPSEFPHAKVTNVSGGSIKKGTTISYKFSNGAQATVKLQADLVDKASFITPESSEAGFKCSAKLL